MTTLAILNSETLLGKEIKESLGRRPGLVSEIRLLSQVVDDFGMVTDGPDGAQFVVELDKNSLDGVDILIECPSEDGDAPSLDLAAGPTRIRLLSTAAAPPLGQPIVASVNLDKAFSGQVLLSPPPTVVALASFLGPLRAFGISAVSCWALQPASLHGQRGLDELLDQTRAILSFSAEKPREIFGSQLAFNVFRAPTSGDVLAQQLMTVFDREFDATVQVLQAGIFHGVVVGASLQLGSSVGISALREALTSSPVVEIAEPDATVGPVAVAGGSTAVLADLQESADGRVSLWGAVDNLTAGGAENAIAILEALVAPRQ